MGPLHFIPRVSRSQFFVLVWFVGVTFAMLQSVDCGNVDNLQQRLMDKRYVKSNVPLAWIKWRISYQRTLFTNNESVTTGLTVEQMTNVKTISKIDVKEDEPAPVQIVRKQKQRHGGACFFNVVSCFGRSTAKSHRLP